MEIPDSLHEDLSTFLKISRLILPDIKKNQPAFVEKTETHFMTNTCFSPKIAPFTKELMNERHSQIDHG